MKISRKKKGTNLKTKYFKSIQIHSPFKVHLTLNSLCFQVQNDVYLCVIYRVQTVKLRAYQIKESFVYVLQLTHTSERAVLRLKIPMTERIQLS